MPTCSSRRGSCALPSPITPPWRRAGSASWPACSTRVPSDIAKVWRPAARRPGSTFRGPCIRSRATSPRPSRATLSSIWPGRKAGTAPMHGARRCPRPCATYCARRSPGTADVGAVFARLLDDPELRYRNGDEILTHAQRCLDAATAAIDDWFGILPQAPCVLTPVPEYLAADVPPAYYMPPAPDGSRPGEYHVNLHEPTERGRPSTASIAFHEAIPGHHLQLAIATERTDLPSFRRMSWGHTAFVEGWALYTERPAGEMGLYESDLDRLGLLASDSWRACRLVVDTGLHAMGWAPPQAIDFMIEHMPVDQDTITVEVDRYIGMPGQALAYKVGQREILRLRDDARTTLGDRFDIKGFHDAVLGAATVSLPVLRRRVGSWVASR